MIDVETGEILKTASSDCECSIEEVVVKTTKEVVAELVETSSPTVIETPGKVEHNWTDDFFNDESGHQPISAKDNKSIIDTSKTKTKKIYGIKIGLNFSSFNGSFSSDLLGTQKIRSGVSLGCFADYKMTEKISFRPELMFNVKGARYTQIRFYLHYLELTTVVKLKLRGRDTIEYNLLIGPYFSVITQSEYSLVSDDYNIEHDLQNTMNLLDWGAVLSFSIDFQAGKDRIFLELRSEHGLMHNGKLVPEYGLDNNAYNRVVALVLGIYI